MAWKEKGKRGSQIAVFMMNVFEAGFLLLTGCQKENKEQKTQAPHPPTVELTNSLPK